METLKPVVQSLDAKFIGDTEIPVLSLVSHVYLLNNECNNPAYKGDSYSSCFSLSHLYI